MNDGASLDANIHESIFEAAADALGLAILVCDRNDEIVYASRPLLQYYPMPVQFLQPGTRLRDFIGAVFDTGVPLGTASDKSVKRVNREDWISQQVSLHWRERVETVERVGRNRWLSQRRRRLSSGLGILAVSDVSDQKKREEQTTLDLERVQLMEEILDCLPNPVCVKDENLAYIAVNKAFCVIHGMAADSILGRSAWDVVEPDLAERFETTDRLTLDTGTVFYAPEQIVQADGEDMWVVTRKYRVGEAGRFVVVTCMDDVTALVVADQSGGRAGGALPLRVENYETFQPAQNCYDPFRSMDVHALADAGAMIDPVRMTRGRVLVLTADMEHEQSRVAQLRRLGFDSCAVRDLDELAAFQSAILNAGLTVDALLVDGDEALLHAVKSRWHAGPCFSLLAESSAQALQAVLLEAALEGGDGSQPDGLADDEEWHIVLADADVDTGWSDVEVLVAEDNEINQLVFTQILEGLGISHRLAANGEEAVRLWRQHRPNLVLMDVSMPVMNGFDAARAIRAAEKDGSVRTPIVAVMANALDSDLENSRAAGMDGHVMKPVSPDMIEAIYRKFVTIRRTDEGRDRIAAG